MNLYYCFNLVFTAVSIIFSIFFKPARASFGIAIKIAIIFVLIGYPWDYFAIRNHAWHYSKYPGVSLYGVPLNDLWFVFVASYISCIIFGKSLNKTSEIP